MSDFLRAIPHILHHEGGWVNHPSDPGGATNWGVSLRFALATLKVDLNKDGWLDGDFDHDGDIDADDIRKMTKEDAIGVYRVHFWKPQYGAIANQLIANKVFDMSVNMGSKQAHKLLQRAAGVGDDGVFGNGTLAAVNGSDAVWLMRRICEAQKQFYLGLIVKNPKLKAFEKGWMKRAMWAGQ
jgi:lysozyme family protein